MRRLMGEVPMRRRRGLKTQSISIIIGQPESEFGLELAADHVLRIEGRDLHYAPAKEGPLTWWEEDFPSGIEGLLNMMPDEKIQFINIFANHVPAKKLRMIFDLLDDRLGEKFCICLIKANVDQHLWNLLVSRTEMVHFILCRFGRGWWQGPREERACSDLTFDRCIGVAPKNLPTSVASWAAIESLSFVGDPPSPQDLGPRESFPEYRIKSGHGYMKFSSALLRGLSHQQLKFLNVRNFADMQWMKGVFPIKGLRHLVMSESICSGDVFDEVVRNLNLTFLQLCRKKGDSLDFRKLKNLKKLKSLDLSSSWLNDRDLALILRYSSPAQLIVYYSNLTSKSLPAVLRHPTLRDVWSSAELVSGRKRVLPESTQIERFVMVNCMHERYGDLVQAYEGLILDIL